MKTAPEIKTLRDEFAIAAMRSLINHPQFQSARRESVMLAAYAFADCALKTRKEKPDETKKTAVQKHKR